MKKRLVLVLVLGVSLFLFACSEEGNDNELETVGIALPSSSSVEQISNETASNSDDSSKKEPLLVRVEAELAKEVNVAGNIFQGQFDKREIGFAIFQEGVGIVDGMIRYALEEPIQLELIDFIKQINLEIIQAPYYRDARTFDFWIIRPRYASYLSGPYIAIDLGKKELWISGAEGLSPNLYKVSVDEDLVFDKLTAFFNQGKEAASYFPH